MVIAVHGEQRRDELSAYNPTINSAGIWLGNSVLHIHVQLLRLKIVDSQYLHYDDPPSKNV